MPSTVYAISIWHGLSRLSKGMEQCERQIVKIRAEESGHLYSHHLSRDLVIGTRQRHYLVTVLDACTRLARATYFGTSRASTFFTRGTACVLRTRPPTTPGASGSMQATITGADCLTREQVLWCAG